MPSGVFLFQSDAGVSVACYYRNAPQGCGAYATSIKERYVLSILR